MKDQKEFEPIAREVVNQLTIDLNAIIGSEDYDHLTKVIQNQMHMFYMRGQSDMRRFLEGDHE